MIYLYGIDDGSRKACANGPWTMSLADSYVQPWPHDQ
jgi:hypothetical protein